jgi:hypothetical protein
MSKRKVGGLRAPPADKALALEAFIEGKAERPAATDAKRWAPERQLPVRLPVALFDKIQRECFERSVELGRRYSMAERIREILVEHYGATE